MARQSEYKENISIELQARDEIVHACDFLSSIQQSYTRTQTPKIEIQKQETRMPQIK
jgi:hypothetical protein